MVTYPWRSTEIQQNLALLEEPILLVELDQLERGSGSVAFLLGKLVPFVKTTLSVLLLDRHGKYGGAAWPRCWGSTKGRMGGWISKKCDCKGEYRLNFLSQCDPRIFRADKIRNFRWGSRCY